MTATLTGDRFKTYKNTTRKGGSIFGAAGRIRTTGDDLRSSPVKPGIEKSLRDLRSAVRIHKTDKEKTTRKGGSIFGAAGRIRTADLILTKDALYLLSYSSKVHAPY